MFALWCFLGYLDYMLVGTLWATFLSRVGNTPFNSGWAYMVAIVSWPLTMTFLLVVTVLMITSAPFVHLAHYCTTLGK